MDLIDGQLPLDKMPDPIFGPRPGVVVDDKDPLKMGRLRVRAHQVYGDPLESEFIEDEMLPWARPCFPSVGEGVGTFHIPTVGSGVWLSFWQGDWKVPIWQGGYLAPSDVPDELTSAYKDGPPKTRIVKTAGGQIIEMRWVNGQEIIHIQASDGTKIDVKSGGPSGDGTGPSIECCTPDGSFIKLFDATAQGGARMQMNTTGNTEIVSAGDATVTVGGNRIENVTGDSTETVTGATTETYTGSTTLNYLINLIMAVTAALTITAGTTIAITATGVLSLSGASLVLASLTGLVSLGVAGAKQKLVTENYITTVQVPNKVIFDAHTHLSAAPGLPSTPPLLSVPGIPWTLAVPGTHSTINTEAN